MNKNSISILHHAFYIACIILLTLCLFTSNYEHPIQSTQLEPKNLPTPSTPSQVKVTTYPNGSKSYEVAVYQQIPLKTSISGKHFETKKFLIHIITREILEQIRKLLSDYQDEKMASIRAFLVYKNLRNVSLYFMLTLIFVLFSLPYTETDLLSCIKSFKQH